MHELLLKTIKVPSNLANLSTRLPKSNYERSREAKLFKGATAQARPGNRLKSDAGSMMSNKPNIEKPPHPEHVGHTHRYEAQHKLDPRNLPKIQSMKEVGPGSLQNIYNNVKQVKKIVKNSQPELANMRSKLIPQPSESPQGM